MYCMNCGEKNDDQARFCIKCGQPLAGDTEKNSPVKKKSKNGYMITVSLILVAAIIVVSVFDLWPWSARTDNDTNIAQTGKTGDDKKKSGQTEGQTITNTVTFDTFSLDEIIAQCPDCQAALETYIATIAVCQDWTTSQETIEALENQKCAQMQHFCTAQAIYVENIPYAFHGSYGFYTGDWIGAGPAGKGTYFGSIYDTNIVSYTGDWGFGMPNGEGELYLENYFGPWDMTE